MAQEVVPEEELWMEPDRPGVSTGTGVMPFKKVMWETGFEATFASGDYYFLLPTTMFRFGITKFAELRIEYDGMLVSDAAKKWSYTITPLILGTKVRIFDGSEKYKWLPKTSLMVNLDIPCTKELAQAMHVAPSAYLLFSNDVTDWFNIGYNVGAIWNGMDVTPYTFFALCLGFSITDWMGAFIESYNYVTDYGKNFEIGCGLDGGFNFMVHDRVQLDVYANIDARDPVASSTFGLGVAWLIN